MCKIIIHILIQQRHYFNPVGREGDRTNLTMSKKKLSFLIVAFLNPTDKIGDQTTKKVSVQ
jgi:hypothetical protein